MSSIPDQIPAVTTTWTSQPGDSRKATVRLLRTPRFWIAPIYLALLSSLGVLLTLTLAAGSTRHLYAVLIYFVVAVAALAAILLRLYESQCRAILRAGSTWAVGADANLLRIDTPKRTYIVRREDIQRVRHEGPLTTVRLHETKERFVIPSQLLGDPALATLTTRQ